MEYRINIAEIYYDRYIKSIIFGNENFENFKKGLYDKKVLNVNFVNHLLNFVNDLGKRDYLESHEIDIIYDIISHIKEKFPYKDIEEKKKYNEVFNHMILTLNCLEGKGIVEVYLQEYAHRLLGKKIVLLEKNFSYYQKIIKNCFEMDFVYVNYAFGLVADKDFETHLTYLANDVYYFMFLNSLLFENDELLASKSLIERTKRIIECNQEYRDLESTRQQKKTLKKYKRYYKMILDLFE